MKYTREIVEEIIEYCGGDKKLIGEYIDKKQKTTVYKLIRDEYYNYIQTDVMVDDYNEEELLKSHVIEVVDYFTDEGLAQKARDYLDDLYTTWDWCGGCMWDRNSEGGDVTGTRSDFKKDKDDTISCAKIEIIKELDVDRVTYGCLNNGEGLNTPLISFHVEKVILRSTDVSNLDMIAEESYNGEFSVEKHYDRWRGSRGQDHPYRLSEFDLMRYRDKTGV